jgi:GGDEF domain-containing protein
MQQMMGVLGHALTVISGDSDRTVGRLQRIQETIQRTATLQDITLLRASLRDIVQLIGEESSKERQAGMREREGLESQVVRFRERVAGHPNRRLPGRVEAIRALSDSVASVPAGNTVWVLAFVFDQLKAIVQRYGAEATDDLFLQVLRERLQPLAPAYTAFRWSPNALVGVVQFQSGTETVQADMARLNQAPLVYRVSLGGRTAVLKVGLSHLSLEASGPRFSSIERLVEGVDGFTGYAGAV